MGNNFRQKMKIMTDRLGTVLGNLEGVGGLVIVVNPT